MATEYTNPYGYTRPEIIGMNDSFGFLPKMQGAMERDAYEPGDPKTFDVGDAEEQLEVCS